VDDQPQPGDQTSLALQAASTMTCSAKHHLTCSGDRALSESSTSGLFVAASAITPLFRQKASVSVSSWLMVCTLPGTMFPPDSINFIDAQCLGIGLLEQVWSTPMQSRIRTAP
jgi:hypothetical protein